MTIEELTEFFESTELCPYAKGDARRISNRVRKMKNVVFVETIKNRYDEKVTNVGFYNDNGIYTEFSYCWG